MKFVLLLNYMDKQSQPKSLMQTFEANRVIISFKDLPAQWLPLVERANDAMRTSYAPYSKFQVGAALLLDNDQIVLGSNQENAAYPLCMCAERVALYTANVIAHNIEVKAIAITAKSDKAKSDKPVSPCGACRQVLYEREVVQKSEIALLCGYQDGPFVLFNSISEVLPLAFGPDALL